MHPSLHVGFLTVAWALLSNGQTALFNSLTPVYSGGPLWPEVSVAGQERHASLQCREINPVAAPTVFSNLPTVLALSYSSFGFAANQTTALGNQVRLSGTARVADHAEVVMVTWATAAKYPELAASDSTGYRHPVTATLYEIQTSSSGAVTLLQLEQNTVQIHVPWRPVTLPDGKPYPYNGYAFQTAIPFSAAVRVSEQCLIAISFNTQSSGPSPLGIAGPYNELNLGLGTSAPKIGSDVSADEVFWIKNGQWFYPARSWGGYGSPMLSLGARAVAPTGAILTPDAPVHAGTYHIEATVVPEGMVAGAVMTVAKKNILLETSGVTKSIADPDPFLTVTTQSPGLAVSIHYEGSPARPSKPGTYPFTVGITDPNHTGSLSGVFRLTGLTYQQWQQLEGPQTGAGSEDPDSDGQANWLEYALGGDPEQSSPLLRLDPIPGGARARFMKRREMPDVRVALEYSADLTTWLPMDTATATVDDLWESVSATSVLPAAYFRVRADPESSH